MPTGTQLDLVENLPKATQQIIREHQGNMYVELRPLFKALGIGLVFSDFPDHLSGDSSYADGQSKSGFVVRINKNHNDSRRRFTGGHELGHCLLHGEKLKALSNDPLLGSLNRSLAVERCLFLGTPIFDPFLDSEEQLMENEADRFSAEVLMPPRAINKAFRAGFETTAEMASVMRVSRCALELRRQELRRI